MFGKRWAGSKAWRPAQDSDASSISGSRHKDPDISLGDRFFSRDSTGQTWVVDRVFTPPGHPAQHVRMHRVERQCDCRTISSHVLRDRNMFGRDRREEQVGDPQNYQRRRFDIPIGRVRSTV